MNRTRDNIELHAMLGASPDEEATRRDAADISIERY